MYDAMHKAFSRLAEHHLAKARQAKEDGDTDGAMEHGEVGAECAQCAKAIHAHIQKEKVAEVRKSDMGGGAELRPLPEGFARVVPGTLIPRHGMSPVEVKTIVPREFERLVKVDEDGEGA